MAHSYSSLGYQKILMNGKEVGEIETRAALAGWFGVPGLLPVGRPGGLRGLEGDRARCRDGYC